MNTTATPPAAPAGRSIESWTREVGLSRAGYYNMPPRFRPQAVKVGKRNIIIEAPADWLRRMAETGGVPTKVQDAAV